MHKETTRALYELFSEDNKGDFYQSYVYLKNLKHFVHHIKEVSGIPSVKPEEEIDEAAEEMLGAIIQQISEAAGSRDTSTYHQKVMILKDAIQMVTQKEDLCINTPEQVVPYKQAKDIILNNPDSIAVGPCACRETSPNPCMEAPMEVCLFVGEPHASFMAEHNSSFRKITQDEAVEILNTAREKGFVHCAEFKKEMGRRFFVVCNCCSCCCLGIQTWNNLQGQIPFMAPSGYVARIDDTCTGCGECVESCNFNAINMKEDVAIVDQALCMGCGVCENRCSVGSISLHLEPSKGAPLDLEALKG